jgi:chaperone modulatory protein CbpM
MSDNQELSEMVEYGLLEPRGQTPEEWCFTTDDIVRVKQAKRLQQDLNLNLSGAVLALELLDEIRELRERLSCFEK